MIAPDARYDPASVLNPEAGSHVVAHDPREVRAARRAAQRSWADFPYYGRRYGARGRRFALSDSGWLATLRDLPAGAAVEQVRWLGGVLSARGMPRWLLERHLEILHEELAAAVPGGDFGVLRAGAAALRASREEQVAPARFQALADDFDARVGAPWNRRLRGMGGILVSAVADERAGIEQAVPVLTAWACDPTRFPPEWIAAVEATLAAARA